jgi:hypothetical protein
MSVISSVGGRGDKTLKLNVLSILASGPIIRRDDDTLIIDDFTYGNKGFCRGNTIVSRDEVLVEFAYVSVVRANFIGWLFSAIDDRLPKLILGNFTHERACGKCMRRWMIAKVRGIGEGMRATNLI